MSNAYINQVLFGNSKEQVDEEYVCKLMPLMLTDERMKRFQTNVPLEIATNHYSNSLRTDANFEDMPKEPTSDKKELVLDMKPRFQQQKNSLFWAIYDLEYPEESFLRTKANIEVEHRLKVVSALKATPKRLKETNSKLTIEQTQSLLGSMLVAKEDKLDFCIAYSAYYNKPIVVVYEKTYCVFSPMVDIQLEGEDVIILYASKPESSKYMIYSSEKNASSDLVDGIMKTKVLGTLKAISSYKNGDLDDIAAKLNIPVKQIEQDETNRNRQKEKRRKKEDIYNDIKVAIHKDMNFISDDSWNAMR